VLPRKSGLVAIGEESLEVGAIGSRLLGGALPAAPVLVVLLVGGPVIVALSSRR
jgi:hypothetical protein